MTKRDYSGAKAVVVGFGVTGRAVYEFFQNSGATVDIFDDHVSERVINDGEIIVKQIGVGFEQCVRDADVVVVSPGIPRSHQIFEIAENPMSELELAFRNTDTPILAITGTNGKTTVTTLISEMLTRGGFSNAAVGNIGTPLISKINEDVEFLVVEASSFQLATTTTFRPKVAAFTNFSPDHLDWHQGIDDYLASKSKIFANQSRGDFSVVNGVDEVVSKIQLPVHTKKITFGRGNFDFALSTDGNTLLHLGVPFISARDLKRALPHDLDNALASAAVASCVGVDFNSITQVLSDFNGLPHRVELIAKLNGVSYFDDSKATTPASVVAALKGFDSAVLIAGGKNKGLDLTTLNQVAENLRAVVAIGDSSDEIASIFSQHDHLKVAKAGSMDEAVALARSFAISGDAVILSPGCTSFDWYRSYVERGDDFKRVVTALAASGGGK